jgi:hypothetical protein
MLTKQGSKHKNTLESLDNTLHNIIMEREKEKIEREIKY